MRAIDLGIAYQPGHARLHADILRIGTTVAVLCGSQGSA
jgi:hypothetical protein